MVEEIDKLHSYLWSFTAVLNHSKQRSICLAPYCILTSFSYVILSPVSFLQPWVGQVVSYSHYVIDFFSHYLTYSTFSFSWPFKLHRITPIACLLFYLRYDIFQRRHVMSVYDSLCVCARAHVGVNVTLSGSKMDQSFSLYWTSPALTGTHMYYKMETVNPVIHTQPWRLWNFMTSAHSVPSLLSLLSFLPHPSLLFFFLSIPQISRHFLPPFYLYPTPRQECSCCSNEEDR